MQRPSLTPATLGSLDLKNRVFRPAHLTRLGGGRVNEDLIAFHEARARGGVAVSVIEAMTVHRSSPCSLNPTHGDLAEGYAQLVKRMAGHGTRLVQLLAHYGFNARPPEDAPPWSASDLPGPAIGIPALPMTEEMIDEVVAGFAAAAEQCCEWGADGVEIDGSAQSLIFQFLSPATNLRDDNYGRDKAGRARLLNAIVREVRSAVPDNAIIGFSLCQHVLAIGEGLPDIIAVLADAVRDGLVNYVVLPADHGLNDLRGLLGDRVAMVLTGGIDTLERADALIASAAADFVGIDRATIAEPDLVKLQAIGDSERVRPCIRCDQGCVGNVLSYPMRLACTANPIVGNEAGEDADAPAPAPQTVLVIGGGPAGMQAALTAAQRGHHVTLVEARESLGGDLRLAARTPGRERFGLLGDWFERELGRLGVDIRLNSPMNASQATAFASDAVIVATGSTPRMDGVQLSNPGEPVHGMNLDHVVSVNGLICGALERPVGNAVVIDDAGGYEGLAACEFLAAAGWHVDVVTRHPALGASTLASGAPARALQRTRGQCGVHLRQRAIDIDEHRVLIGPTYLPRETNRSQSLPADLVVFISHDYPDHRLRFAIAEGGTPTQIVGDANAARDLTWAVSQGHSAAMSI